MRFLKYLKRVLEEVWQIYFGYICDFFILYLVKLDKYYCVYMEILKVKVVIKR